MLKIYPDTKIYIHIPAGAISGGPELLHQLADILNRNGRAAYVVYYGAKDYITPKEYEQYNVKISSYIEDDSHNIEIYPEVQGDEIIQNTRLTQKFFWWLSVDNFFRNKWDWHNIKLRDIFRFSFSLGVLHLIDRIKCSIYYKKNFFKGKRTLALISKFDSGYQAEYIRNFLSKVGFKNIYPLSDFINDRYFEEKFSCKKNDIVLYNPKKGFEFTKKLIESAPDLSWVPLENLNRTELIKLIRSAKLYIDFGNHPGKDRLPRECAISGCCIITGKKGSAAFFKDVPIKNKYKFNDNDKSIQDIIATIRWVLSNYEQALVDFEDYREKIAAEKKIFETQIGVIFKTSNYV